MGSDSRLGPLCGLSALGIIEHGLVFIEPSSDDRPDQILLGSVVPNHTALADTGACSNRIEREIGSTVLDDDPLRGIKNSVFLDGAVTSQNGTG